MTETNRNRGNTVIEALLLLLAVVLVFVVGLWVGSSDNNSGNGTATVTTTETTTAPSAVPQPPATAGKQTAEPDPLSLSALSLATTPGRKGKALPGSQALIEILGEPTEQRTDKGRRAGYWSTVATTLAVVGQMESAASEVKTHAQVSSNRPFLQAAQARALYQVGALQQMTIATTQSKLTNALGERLGGAVNQSIFLTNKALRSKSDKDAAALSDNSRSAGATVLALQTTYSQALAAALAGGYVSANDLLAKMVPTARKLS
ncbi:MAG: hypothetical protein U0R52_11135 [Solirubrobacterales bacterium]